MESSKLLGYMLGRTMRVFKIQMVLEFKEQGIEPSVEQFIILSMMNSNNELIQKDLANHLQKDKSIIVRYINGLLEKQQIVRFVNKEDKRKKNLILTEKGVNVLAHMKEIESEVSKKLLHGITESELETFRNVLIKIQENGGIDEETFDC